MSTVVLNNPKRLSNEMQIQIARMAEKQARIVELGFQINEKIWCKLTYGSILIQAMQGLELLTEDEQNNIITMYNKLMNQ